MSDLPSRAQRMPRAQRRAQLLAAAQTVFVDKGYHASAMEDIADEAGVSKPVLYQHFPGKLELYLALLDTQADRLEALVLEALDVADHKERVYATMAAFFSFVGDEEGAFRLIFESDLTNEPAVRHRIDGLEAQIADAIAARITTDTALPAELSQLLGGAIAGMSQVSARAWLAHSPSVPQSEAALAAGHLLWRGIRAFPVPGGSPGATS